MSATFTKREIHIDGTSIFCHDAGHGAPVVTLHGEAEGQPTGLEKLLAEKFRVIALKSRAFGARVQQQAAELIGQLAKTLDLGHHVVIAGPSATSMALRTALDRTVLIDAVVLISPTSNVEGLEPHLGEIKAPTLILVGAGARPTPSAARLCADRIPEAYLMLVYDGSPEMENERPAALFEAVADFVERKGRFVVERQDSVLSP